MKKVIFLLLTGLVLNGSTIAQQAAKSIYFELGGPGLASFNFDTRFTKKEGGIGGRIGFGGFAIDGSSAIFVPVGLNYLFGKDSKNYFEIGAGVTPVFIDEGEDDVSEDDTFTETFGHLLFGYRLQPIKSGFTFRAFMCPIFDSQTFFPLYGGVSFGYKF
jgi:hypothetical protein